MNCPYHHITDCARPRPVTESGDPLWILDCGFPARLCASCGWTNRSYAGFCRHCSAPADPPGVAPRALAVLKALWSARPGDEPVMYSVPLPPGSRSVTALASGWGFLFAGTAVGTVVVFSSLRPGPVLETIRVRGTVVALECIEAGWPEWRRGPSLVATTDEGVFLVPLLAAAGAQPLGGDAEARWTAGAATALGAGVLAFRRANSGVEPVWLPWDEAARDGRATAEPFAGPVSRPVRLDGRRVAFFGSGSAHVFHAPNGVPAHVGGAQLALAPEPSYAPSYLPATEEVFYVYRRGTHYGVARTSATTLDTVRCTEPRYTAAQVVAVDQRAIFVASDHDLEIIAPASGDRLWSLRDHQHEDGLNLAEFQPVLAEGHLLLLGRTVGASDALFLLPIRNDALRDGPRRLSGVGRPLLPPMVVPGGVICAARDVSDPDPVLRVIHPTRHTTV